MTLLTCPCRTVPPSLPRNSYPSGRIGAEEVINDTDGKEAEELDELLKEEAAKTQAILLEMERDCEKAFFKMDNVLIDDRLIHVDFSQSVSKMKWKGKVGQGGTPAGEKDRLAAFSLQGKRRRR
ncbi:peptidyl-prolyl cis-trans isomerase-like 4 [Oncorhynchus nerka]|uniref:peptidyl-prolyl cis-trans isomerase-like 4 n=1 Tax=Oncorhynchus nerka TaxID=8023 RepID=UPI0031B86BB8